MFLVFLTKIKSKVCRRPWQSGKKLIQNFPKDVFSQILGIYSHKPFSINVLITETFNENNSHSITGYDAKL